MKTVKIIKEDIPVKRGPLRHYSICTLKLVIFYRSLLWAGQTQFLANLAWNTVRGSTRRWTWRSPGSTTGRRTGTAGLGPDPSGSERSRVCRAWLCRKLILQGERRKSLSSDPLQTQRQHDYTKPGIGRFVVPLSLSSWKQVNRETCRTQAEVTCQYGASRGNVFVGV